MKTLTVIAHRGWTVDGPGNTIEAIRAAHAAGADGVEIDVRLTRDGVPVVHHNWYLDESETSPAPIHAFTAEALGRERVRHERPAWSGQYRIPTLADILEEFAGRLKLEIELKSPEPELVEAVVSQLGRFPDAWETVEVTSDMTSLLERVRDLAPRLETAVLVGRAPQYMRADVIGYVAVHLARQAGTHLVHIERDHLREGVIDQLRAAGMIAHVYPVNDAEHLALALRFGIAEVVTDDLPQLLALRGSS